MKLLTIAKVILPTVAASFPQLSDTANNTGTTAPSHHSPICAEPPSTQTDLCSAVDGEDVFPSSPIDSQTLQLDVRPADCQSFFEDYLHTRRGLRIEDALQHIEFYKPYESTVTTFPIVDFISNDHIRVVKTRDLSAAVFNSPGNTDTLYDLSLIHI